MRTAWEHLIAKPDKISYKVPCLNRSRILVVAPHADDETLGCGGTIHQLILAGHDVLVVVMTNERNKSSSLEGGGVREKEFAEAMRILGCEQSKMLALPDGELAKNIQWGTRELSVVMERFVPDVVFCPYVLDVHPDHWSTNIMVSNGLDRIRQQPTMIWYEVWTPILHPNCYIDISGLFDLKRKAMEAYIIQEHKYQISKKTELLNQFRAETLLRRNKRYMEVFKTIDSVHYREIVKTLYSSNQK